MKNNRESTTRTDRTLGSTTGQPRRLRCEHMENPLGLDEGLPRLSWQMDDSRSGARQTAYQIKAASQRALLDSKPDLWDSGRKEGDQCLDIPWGGLPLASRQTVHWRVRVWDHKGRASAWSEPASFEMGLLATEDWTAQWIGRPLENRDNSQPCPYLRREFLARGPIASARVFVTARGLFELHLNGQRVGNEYFTPGWTDFPQRIQYRAYDVTNLVKPGANAIGAILGDGWYAGNLLRDGNRFVSGDQLSLRAQLEVVYADGQRDCVPSDSRWRTSFGPIRMSDLYNGETYDARLDMPGWNQPAFDDKTWAPAVVYAPPAARLTGNRGPAVCRQEELAVRAVTEPKPGVHVFDLGQNMVGWARVKVRAPKGRQVTIRFAEMLNADGTLYLENLRSAKSTNVYICNGGGEEVHEPRFTFHGFRYVELTGLSEKPKAGDVTGVVLHSKMETTGSFTCSNELVNRLQRNILWSQRGNFLEVPTDCPQRDERLGWTGDAQVFIRTACFNQDVAAFFTKWGLDLMDAQHADGAFPHVVPDVIRDGGRGAAAWSDAGVICPWTIYLCYGDRRMLERHYDSMVRWVAWWRANSRDLICSSACFGDWLAIDIAEGDPARSPTPRDLIATAYFAHCATIVARVAAILGREADAKAHADLAAAVRRAFNREFVSPTGRLAGDTQTAYLLALGFDLLPKGKQAHALACLVQDLEKRGWHLSTGFVGTPLLAPVLSRFGRDDVVYKLLLQETYPGWLYPILQGDATTMWERWNSYTKDKGFGNAAMNSFNHYAYGAVGEWLYNRVAGIDLDPDKPGYKHLILRPCPGGGLTWARGELATRYGKASCAWELVDGTLTVTVQVPPNTQATLILPGRRARKLKAGRHVASCNISGQAEPRDARG